jgi:GntR family transcriptional regulator/MocR family aminotransferase
MHQQLNSQISQAVLSGRLPSGLRLPASRDLAVELSVSRTTVVTAFQQLIAEGYLESRVGAGTFVGSNLTKQILELAPLPDKARASQKKPAYDLLSHRGRALVDSRSYGLQQTPTAFMPNQPAYDKFPFDIWARILGRQNRKPAYELLNYGTASGYPPLQRAIAAYLHHARGIKCDERQIIVVTGAQMAVSLSAWILLNPGDGVMIEDPGFIAMRDMLAGFGARLINVPVDHRGMDVSAGIKVEPDARMVLLAPSHQYPLGVTLSLARRLELLAWAKHVKGWIIEDDYDSEFRFSGAPIAPMQTIDQNGRVIYVGTFSKVMFPSLRVGYLVVPPALVDAYGAAVHLLTRGVSTLTQAALAEFIDKDHFSKHIRRMRLIYAERHEAMTEALHKDLDGLINVSPAKTGMNVVGWLPQNGKDNSDDLVAVRKLNAHGILSAAMSVQYSVKQPRHGLLLGFGCSSVEEIRYAVKKMARALDPPPFSKTTL